MPRPGDDDKSRRRTGGRGERDRSDRARNRDDDGPPRGPRRPIKGRRRTFDTDSAPTARERARLEGGSDRERPPGGDDERWVDEGPVRRAAGAAVERGSKRPPGRGGATRGGPKSGRKRRDDEGRGGKRTPARAGEGSSSNDNRRRQRAAKRAEQALELDRDRLVRQLGAAKADRSISRLGDAADAFAQDRFEEARKLLKPLADAIPDEPAIRELYGLTLYRLGRWRLAAAELEAFADRTRSVEQHPVLADCYRALGQHRRVAELWDELGETSPEASVVAEGRIVLAGSHADQGDIAKAIATLEAGSLGSKPLRFHHLRMRYAVADLYDRAGEHQAARRQFEAVATADPDFFDVRDRLRQL
jgi:tetratricopeptide (TPR) repeat protein